MLCEHCKNALFNELWGEYKCKVDSTTIYENEIVATCGIFKEGTPEVSKEDRYPEED